MRKLKYYINQIKAKRNTRFRIRTLNALRSIIGGYLACAYEGHQIRLSDDWDNGLYGFSCKNCPLYYIKSKDRMTEKEKAMLEKEKNET